MSESEKLYVCSYVEDKEILDRSLRIMFKKACPIKDDRVFKILMQCRAFGSKNFVEKIMVTEPRMVISALEGFVEDLVEEKQRRVIANIFAAILYYKGFGDFYVLKKALKVKKAICFPTLYEINRKLCAYISLDLKSSCDYKDFEFILNFSYKNELFSRLKILFTSIGGIKSTSFINTYLLEIKKNYEKTKISSDVIESYLAVHGSKYAESFIAKHGLEYYWLEYIGPDAMELPRISKFNENLYHKEIYFLCTKTHKNSSFYVMECMIHDLDTIGDNDANLNGGLKTSIEKWLKKHMKKNENLETDIPDDEDIIEIDHKNELEIVKNHSKIDKSKVENTHKNDGESKWEQFESESSFDDNQENIKAYSSIEEESGNANDINNNLISLDFLRYLRIFYINNGYECLKEYFSIPRQLKNKQIENYFTISNSLLDKHGTFITHSNFSYKSYLHAAKKIYETNKFIRNPNDKTTMATIKNALKFIMPKLFKLGLNTNCSYPFFKVIYSFGNLNISITILLENCIEDIEYFLTSVDNFDFVIKVFYNAAFFGRGLICEFIMRMFEVKAEHLDKVWFLSTIGRGFRRLYLKYDKIPLKLEECVKDMSLCSFEGNFPDISCYIDYTKLEFMAFFGDEKLIGFIGETKINELFELLLLTVQGFEYSKKYWISSSFKETRQTYLKIFTSFKDQLSLLHNTNYSEIKVYKEYLVEQLYNLQMIELLIETLPYLYPENSEYSKNAFKYIGTCNEDIAIKQNLIQKLIIFGYSPLSYFKSALNFNSSIFRNPELMDIYMKLCPNEVKKLSEEICAFTGNIKIIKFLNSYSIEGIAKYGKTEEYMYLTESNYNICEYSKIELCKLAIKARNTEMISLFLDDFTPDECYSMLLDNDYEILFDLAFYMLDTMAEKIFDKLSQVDIVVLKHQTYNGFTAFAYRLLVGSFTDIWSPLNNIFSNIVRNQFLIFVYIDKLFKHSFNIVYNVIGFKNAIQDFSTEIEVINFMYKSVLDSFIEQKAQAIEVLLVLGLIPSESIFDYVFLKFPLEFVSLFIETPRFNHYKMIGIVPVLDSINVYNKNKYFTQKYLFKLSHLGSKELLSWSIDCDEIDEKLKNSFLMGKNLLFCILEQLLAGGYVPLYLAMSMKYSCPWETTSQLLLDMQDYISDSLKQTLLLSCALTNIADLILLDEALNYYIIDDYKNIQMLHLHIIKAMNIRKEFLKIINTGNYIKKEVHSKFLEVFKDIEKALIERYKENNIEVVISKNLTNTCFKMSIQDSIFLLSILIKCLCDFFDIYKESKISELRLDTNIFKRSFNKDIAQISINYTQLNGNVEFTSINYFIYEQLDKSILGNYLQNEFKNKHEFEVTIKSIPDNDNKYRKLVNYFFCDKTNFVDFLHEEFCNLNAKIDFFDDSSLYNPQLVQSFTNRNWPNTIVLEEVQDYVFTSSDTVTMNFVLVYRKLVDDYDFVIIKQSFYPYAEFQIKQLFKDIIINFKGLVSKPIEMNYEKYLCDIALVIAKKYQKSPLEVFRNQSQTIEKILLFTQSAIELEDLPMDFLGIFIDFSPVNQWKIYREKNFLVYEIGYIFKQDPNDCIEFFMPSYDFIIEDMLISLYTTKEIVEKYASITYFREWPRKDCIPKYALDIDSIISQHIPHIKKDQNYREAIRFLKALNSELLSEKNFSILIEYFGSDLWDKGMLINLFEKETLIMFKKLHNHERFFDPSFSRYYSYEGRCFIVSDDDKKSEKDKLTVEDFKDGNTIYIRGAYGDAYNIPNSAMPFINENGEVAIPIRNLLYPIPDIIEVSTNANTDAVLGFNEDSEIMKYENPPFNVKYAEKIKWDKLKNMSLLKINSMIRFYAPLKNYVFYRLNIEEEYFAKFVTKTLNYSRKVRTFFHSPSDFKTSIRYVNKKRVWNPVLQLETRGFDEGFEYKQGLLMAENVIDKIKLFLYILDDILNDISPQSSFYSFQGDIFIRPKASLFRKLVIKYISKIHVVLTKDEEKVLVTPESTEYYMNPSLLYEKSLSRDIIIGSLCQMIISFEVSSPQIFKIIYKPQDDQPYTSYLEQLQLISQSPLIAKFFNALKETYSISENFDIYLELISCCHTKITIGKCCNLLRKVTLRPGFFSRCSFLLLGEYFRLKVGRPRPENSLLLEGSITNKRKKSLYLKYVKKNDVMVPFNRSKYYVNKKICIKTSNISQKAIPKMLVTFYYRDFPIYHIFAGRDLSFEKSSKPKYSTFCMLKLKSIYNPIVKASNIKKIMTSPERFQRTTIKVNTEVSFYILSDTKKDIVAKVNGVKTIKIDLEELNIEPIFENLKIFKATLQPKHCGNYFFYNKKDVISSDFILCRVQQADPTKCSLIYNKFASFFELELKDLDDKKFLTFSQGKIHKENSFILNSQTFKLILTDDHSTSIPIETIIRMNTIEFRFDLPLESSQCIFNVLIEDVHVKNSPYVLKTSDNLDQRFRKYVYLCSQNPGFGSEAIINLERAKFIESLKNVFPKTNDCRGRLYINYKGEPGVDAGGLLRDFYDSLGLEGMNEKNKLFEQQNNYYRIHPKSNHKYLKVYGSALANAIIHKNKVPISFCDSLLRIMLKLPLNESSLEVQNPKLYENFKALRAYSSEELESLCLNFTVMVDKKSIPLCKDGKKLYLNHGNLEKYISLMVEWELKGYANKSIEKFIKGFFKVAEPLAGKFSVSELRHVMSGLDNDYFVKKWN